MICGVNEAQPWVSTRAVAGYAKYGINTSNRVLKSPSGIGYGGAMIYGRLVAQYVAKLDAWDAEKKA
ncbi:MAG: hypothetical protein AB2L09_09045 [Coriobacteriia bacterium]